ncbi:hypothetical protein [Mycoplasmopsis agassizii]|uniref:Uncharacterized protein n=1 Tax=Mycoplasmopsis agassizii TaxID=33922 RepID=A0ABX4H6K4_9BACT|nr:hypothetical protein [Mycoplasmopsis agassizii]PAF55540.1 hypothetical protein CJF60_02585 [Mycoplasmopsis agassizii]SMC17925.1 hypothetical protein SAMN02745179_00553 [Mycoplasmopsis agassizii]
MNNTENLTLHNFDDLVPRARKYLSSAIAEFLFQIIGIILIIVAVSGIAGFESSASILIAGIVISVISIIPGIVNTVRALSLTAVLRRFYQTKDLDIAWYLVLGGLFFFFMKIVLVSVAYNKIYKTIERENPDLLKFDTEKTSEENPETSDSEEKPKDNNSETEAQDSKETDK